MKHLAGAFALCLAVLMFGCATGAQVVPATKQVVRTDIRYPANPSGFEAGFVDLPYADVINAFEILGYITMKASGYDDAVRKELQPYVTEWGADAVSLQGKSGSGANQYATFLILKAMKKQESPAVKTETPAASAPVQPPAAAATTEPAVTVTVTPQAAEEKAYTARLWENGKEKPIAEGKAESSIYSLFVSGSDVYAAGIWEDASWGHTEAFCLKNGKPMTLDLSGRKEWGADAVYVSGKDVYVLGWGDWESFYWKNGVRFPLEMKGERKWISNTDMLVSGKDVYATGFFMPVDAEATVAVMWKNGKPTYLTDGSSWGKAEGIAMSGKNVLICGQDDGRAAVWTNGVKSRLAELPLLKDDVFVESEALSIFVSGSDVYVVGYVIQTSRRVGVIWKNNKVSLLSETGHFSPRQVFVSGKDVYVGGVSYADPAWEESKAGIWKNGAITVLSGKEQSGYVFSIFVSGKTVYAAGEGTR